jgi:hypothetical protein
MLILQTPTLNIDTGILIFIIGIVFSIIGFFLNRIIKTVDRIEMKVSALEVVNAGVKEEINSIHHTCEEKHASIDHWIDDKNNIIRKMELDIATVKVKARK